MSAKLNGMIHFRANKKGEVFCTAVAPNGRKLYPTESFTQKPSAWTNVKAVIKLTNGKFVLVQDNTITPAIVYRVTRAGKTATNIKPTKKIPK